MIFQDPRAGINPIRRVGDFLTESLRLNHSWTDGGPAPAPSSSCGPSASTTPSGTSASTRTSCPAACCSG